MRDRLTDAAEQAVAAGGLPALRARELAAAAGCSVGAIYTVFPDLDALALAVNARTLDGLDAALRPCPPGDLAALALAYLDYAAAHRVRWDALFAHRMANGGAVPDWYAARLAALFARVEAALPAGMAAGERSRFARTAFSAVHGVVSLGLDQKLAPLPAEALRAQLRLLVRAIAQ